MKSKIATRILSKFDNVKKTTTGWQASCPAHDDNNPSLSISINDNKILLHCFADCETADVLAAAGLEWADLHLDDQRPKIVAKYDYHDKSEKLTYQVLRYDPKDFSVRRPDGSGGWIYNLSGVRLVPYRVNELKKVRYAVITEGEKDVNSAREIGIRATTNPFGAGKWRPEFNEHFRGKRVFVIRDNDEPGLKHAQSVVCQLFPVAKYIKLIRLPHAMDFTEWVEKGGTRKEFIRILKTTPKITAAMVEQWRTSNSSKDGFSLTQLCDLLNEPEEAVPWTVDGLLPAGGVSLLVAKPKTGKSTLAREAQWRLRAVRNFWVGKLFAAKWFTLRSKRSERKCGSTLRIWERTARRKFSFIARQHHRTRLKNCANW